MKTLRLTQKEAEGFYAVHRARPFFQGLTEFMASGPIVAMVLEAPGRHHEMARADGRNGSGQGRPRHDSKGICELDR